MASRRACFNSLEGNTTLHRSLQIQVLSWLAALATLGAATKPTFDTLLFAAAFVLGTLLMHVRDRLEGKPQTIPHLTGRAFGAVFAWAVVALRHFAPMIKFPPRMTVAMLIAAAVIPTGIFLVETSLALVVRRRVRDQA
jgi:hypothetical protein